jgi:hypothetical protein
MYFLTCRPLGEALESFPTLEQESSDLAGIDEDIYFYFMSAWLLVIPKLRLQAEGMISFSI